MTLRWKQNKPKKPTTNFTKLTRIHSLVANRSNNNNNNNNNKEMELQSYWDNSSQQTFIGQDPTPHRSSLQTSHLSASKALVLAWRSQLAAQSSSSDIKLEHSKAKTSNTSICPSVEVKVKKAPVSRTCTEKILYNQPSMSFPIHLRSKSQPFNKSSTRSSIVFPSVNSTTTFNRQPWWDNATTIVPNIEAKPFQVESKSHAAGQHIFYSLDAAVRKMSTGTMSTSHVTDIDQIAAEISTLSDDESYDTCPCFGVEIDCSDNGSSPTLNGQQDSVVEIIGKDPCQSPLMDLFSFPSPSCDDDFPDQSYSVEYSTNQAEDVTTVKETQDKVDDEPDQRSCTSPIPSSQPDILTGLSLPQLLDEVRDNHNEELVVYGDESFGSSSLDDDEEDSIQICHAWRENIAFAGLGASLANESIQGKSNQVFPRVAQINLAAKRKPSKVSLRTLNLDTIQETSFDSLQQADSETDPSNHLGLCAHLLKRAKEGKLKIVKPRNLA